MFSVMHFLGTGDPAFGGTADDRALYKVAGRLAYMRSCDATAAGASIALFKTEAAALDAEKTADGRRPGGIVSAAPASPWEIKEGVPA